MSSAGLNRVALREAEPPGRPLRRPGGSTGKAAAAHRRSPVAGKPAVLEDQIVNIPRGERMFFHNSLLFSHFSSICAGGKKMHRNIGQMGGTSLARQDGVARRGPLRIFLRCAP